MTTNGTQESFSYRETVVLMLMLMVLLVIIIIIYSHAHFTSIVADWLADSAPTPRYLKHSKIETTRKFAEVLPTLYM